MKPKGWRKFRARSATACTWYYWMLLGNYVMVNQKDLPFRKEWLLGAALLIALLSTWLHWSFRECPECVDGWRDPRKDKDDGS